MFDRLEVFEKKYEECNQKLYDPAVVSDPEAYAALMKEVKGLEPVVEKYKEYKKQKNNEEEAKQLLAEGGLEKDFREMVELELEEARELLAKENPTQAEVDEAIAHLNAAVQALVKAEVKDTLTFAKPKVTLYKGQKKAQTAKVTGKVKAPVYTSSNTKIATVDKKTGKVTAKAAGKVTITAKIGNLKATYTVTVKNPTLKLTKASASVKVGKTTRITAKATPSGKITYKSSNKKVATVSSNGTVKGIKKGTAKITVTCNGVSKTFKVTVK